MTSKALDARIGDPFEPYRSVHRALFGWQCVAASLLVLLAVSLGLVILLACRPPVVIIKDRVHGEPATVTRVTEAPPVTLADARAFFIAMARLRWDWDSLSVAHNMQEFRGHCYRDQRTREQAHLEELVSVDPDEPDKKIPRLQAWQRQGVRNTLQLPDSLDAVTCVEQDETFHCHMRATLMTQPMFPVPDESPKMLHMVLLATFLRVPHTIHTPYGLIVGLMGEGADDRGKETRG